MYSARAARACRRVVGERFGEVLEPGPGVAPQRHLGRPAAADLLGDDLQMDERD